MPYFSEHIWKKGLVKSKSAMLGSLRLMECSCSQSIEIRCYFKPWKDAVDVYLDQILRVLFLAG